MKRVPQQELLDDDLGTPEEIAASLNDLRSINLKFGGVATSRSLLKRAMQSAGISHATLLEVAAGDGFAIREAVKGLNKGLHVEVTALDRRGSHLSNGSGKVVTGDALHLPFSDNAFDFVSCGLFVHHLEPQEVVRFISGSLRVARHALLINDLIRSRLHLSLVQLSAPVFSSRLTKHDAPASVRQAYTIGELRDLIAKASPSRVDFSRHFFYRLGAIVWK
jgi:hypothetical protein